MKRAPSLLLAVVALLPSHALPYEIETHAVVTAKAFARVAEQDPQLLDRLGIKRSEDNLDRVYYDVSGNTIRQRTDQAFENQIVDKKLKFLGVDKLSVPGWLLRGAIREDDGAAALFLSNPQDDDYGNINRFLNHFFDPVNNAPLSIGGQNHTAPAWALGTTNANALSAENTAESGRRNHYSVKDAREYMFRALTGMDGNGSRAIGAGGATPSTPEDKEAVRKAYWATTFRALGDIVHLVQDMGQPQHTRNDPHSPINIVNGERVYEEFTNQRALGGRYTCFFGFGRMDEVPLLDDVYGDYPVVPRFNQFGDFFSTGAGSASGVASGKGLADYSNRGFFTAGTNVGMSRNVYSSPALATAQAVPLGKVSPCFPPGGEAVAFTGTVHDMLDPSQSADNVPLTTRGLWDRGELDPQVRYSLNEQNYIAMADLLIPRAVAYSAGLIDYFFRGRMEITLPSEGVYSVVDHAVVNGVDEGFTKVKLKLRNVTPAINDGQGSYAQTMGPGKLYAVAKYRRNPCYQPDLSGEHTANGAIINGCSASPNPTAHEEIVVSAAADVQSINTTDPQPFSFDFTDNPIPLNATDLYLQVVFRGQIGSEADAVAVVTKDISEPTYYDISNSTDYMLDSNDAYVVNPSPTVINSIGLAFNDSYSFVAQMGALQVATFARVAILVDGANTEIAATNYDSDGSSRYMTPINTNQLDEAGQPQARPFNRCANGDVTQYRGINWLNGVIWWESGGSNCSQYSSLMPFPVLDPVPFDRINF